MDTLRYIMLYFAVPTVTLLITIGLALSATVLVLLLVLAANNNRKATRAILWAGIPLWAIGLAVAVLPGAPSPDPSIPSGTFNWIPFLAQRERDLSVELLANLGLFAPLTLMLAFVWRRYAVFKSTLLVMGLSMSVELTQLLLRNNRASDVTDILTNTTGAFVAALVGWALLTLVKRQGAPRELTQQVSILKS
jgi:glycopeptide antibiotics resistance protein